MSAQVIGFCNQKGGVGKSTTAFHLARAAVLDGQRVLLVDIDPQGNLTSVAAENEVIADQVGLADALSSRAPEVLNDVIVPGIWPGLDVAPTSGRTLEVVRDELVIAGPGREVRLKEALSPVGDQYDLILIDCAPSLDQLTINGLVAADKVVIVAQAKLFAANGLSELLETVNGVRQYYNHGLEIAGILINLFQARTISGQTWLDDLTQAARVRDIDVFIPPIPSRVVISDAMEAASGLDEWGSSDSKEMGDLYRAHLKKIEGSEA